MRTKLGALLGAGGLLLLATSVTMAAPGGNPGPPPGGGPPASHPGGGPPTNDPGPPTINPTIEPTDEPVAPTSDPGGGGGSPTYEIEVSKTADPASVPAAGGTVEFTVFVTATGTGFFQVVNIDDPLAGCTLGAAVVTSGDDDDKLEEGETWSFSCTVDDVMPGTENVATVHACHNVSACNQGAHDATGVGNVTVGEDEDPGDTPDPGSPDPTQDGAGLTQAPTDTVGGVTGGIESQRTLMLVLALGMLLASLILVTPARPVHVRGTKR